MVPYLSHSVESGAVSLLAVPLWVSIAQKKAGLGFCLFVDLPASPCWNVLSLSSSVLTEVLISLGEDRTFNLEIVLLRVKLGGGGIPL